jgi:hypothetical protein
MPVLRATGLMMNRAFAVLAACGVISLAALCAPQSAAARTICQTTNDYLGGSCEENCAKRSSKDWLQSIYGPVCAPDFGWPACPPGSTTLVASDNKSCCPQERMAAVRSCTPVPSPNGSDLCRMKLCGPAVDLRQRARVPRNLDTDRYTTPGPRVGPPQPGNSAMERLGGGRTLSAPSGGGQSGGGSAPRSAAGGASSATSSGGSPPNINSNTITKQAPAFGQTPGLR